MKLNKNEFDIILKALIENNEDFDIKKGKHTQSIITKRTGETFFYAENSVKNNSQINAITKAIKKEIEPHLDFFNVKRSEYEYYHINENITDIKSNHNEIMNIDLKSAYLMALFNSGFISDQLYNKINKLDKKDRLKTIGLLAYRPFLLHYKKGKLKNITQPKNQFQNVFFWCVKQISDMCVLSKNELKNDFLFSWVDGIYFKHCLFNQIIVEDILKRNNYPYTIEFLNNFTAELKEENGHVVFNYYKESEKEKRLKNNKPEKTEIIVPLRHKKDWIAESFIELKRNNIEEFNYLYRK